MATDDESSLKNMADEVNAVIRAEKKRSQFSVFGWITLVLVFVATLFWWFWPADDHVQWQTYRLDLADMVLTATATGNLQPKSEVSVGAEISGLVSEVLVSENDEIKRGQILARFDTEELEVALLQATAGLDLSRASLAEATATLDEAVVDERRTELLVQRGTSSEATLDKALATRKRAEAKFAYARATVRQAEATVSQARTRLEKAVITSPIDGVVLQRSIEPGATVAANFQTPVLFLLAEDLGQMELHVSMDEADVGLVKAGQHATFTVDAWSGREFEAKVVKVYLYPTVENNVVTYTTVLAVDNVEHLLQPGMTATATITTGTRESALRVPNVAFRFTPPASEAQSSGMFGRPGSSGQNASLASSNTLWKLEGDQPRRVLARTGYTDGRYTELLGDELKEGDHIITGVLRGSVE
jgi:HlyD family secretion protein